jgi:hypothetical protein
LWRTHSILVDLPTNLYVKQIQLVLFQQYRTKSVSFQALGFITTRIILVSVESMTMTMTMTQRHIDVCCWLPHRSFHAVIVV